MKKLVVTQAFGDYRVGDEITDEEKIIAVVRDHPHAAVAVNYEPEPAPAPKSK